MELKKWIKELGITLKGQDVYFDTKLVYTLKEGEDSIPSLWCVRVCDPTTLLERPFWSFVTGFDLLEVKEMCWLGSFSVERNWMKLSPMCETYHSKLSNVMNILNTLCIDTKGKDWKFCIEESFMNDTFDENGNYSEIEPTIPTIKIFE